MTVAQWHGSLQTALLKAGFENAFQEAKWLLSSALGKENSFVTLNSTYTPTDVEVTRIQEWLQRRLQGEPLSRLKGVREFWSLDFYLNDHTLDPRPETEHVVDGALKWVGSRKNKGWSILDLGTGSGCILIALLHELKQATGVGVDLSEEALEMARSNAALNHVEERVTFRISHWGEKLSETFDIIVSNPPYIPLAHKENLQSAVRDYDPFLALFAGDDGLACYRLLAPQMKRLLSPTGIAILEIGLGQRQDVETLFHKVGFKTLFVHKDLAGIERVIGLSAL